MLLNVEKSTELYEKPWHRMMTKNDHW